MIVDVGCVVEVEEVKELEATYTWKAHNMALVKRRRLVFLTFTDLKKFTPWPSIDSVSPCYCCCTKSLLTRS